MVVVAITFMAHISLRWVFLFHHILLLSEDKYYDSNRIWKQVSACIQKLKIGGFFYRCENKCENYVCKFIVEGGELF